MPINVSELKLEIYHSSCKDYIKYLDANSDHTIGFEAHFDFGEFNGVISVCKNIGDDEGEEWERVQTRSLYRFLKEKAIQDYNQMFDKNEVKKFYRKYYKKLGMEDVLKEFERKYA